MKNIKIILWGIYLIVISFLMLFFTSIIYDMHKKNITPFIIQPANLSKNRVIEPVKFENLSTSFVMDFLIKKFIYEYFYVIPNQKDLEIRMENKSILGFMSSKNVFENWKKAEAENIKKLINEKKYRDTKIISEIYKPKGSDYYEIKYELKEWNNPNNLEEEPITSNNTLLLKVIFEKSILDTNKGRLFNISEYLEKGNDPSSIFKFKVLEIKNIIRL